LIARVTATEYAVRVDLKCNQGNHYQLWFGCQIASNTDPFSRPLPVKALATSPFFTLMTRACGKAAATEVFL
jgi:hypothetical protein